MLVYAGMLVNLLPTTKQDKCYVKKGHAPWPTLTTFDIDALIDESDRKVFRQATQPCHSLHHLLPPKTSTYSSYKLRKRQHPYLLPTVQYLQFKICYINLCVILVFS